MRAATLFLFWRRPLTQVISSRRSQPARGLGLFLLTLMTTASLSATPPRSAPCSEAKSAAADSAVLKVKDWASLHLFFRSFAACDDGGPSEDISETVVHLLAHRWSLLPKLATEIKAEPRFEAFVLQHIDTTADDRDLIEIRRTATLLCPPGLGGLCKRIKANAASALREMSAG